MKKLAILLDSFSGFTKTQLEELGISMVSQTIIVDGHPYKEGDDITVKNVSSIIKNATDLKSSMPAIGLVSDKMAELSKEAEKVIYMTMNKGMSSTFSTGVAAASEFDNVEVMNAGTLITAMIVEAASTALKMSEEGKSYDEVKKYIEDVTKNSTTFIVVKDTENLIKSGRVGTAKKLIMEKVKLIPRLQVIEEGFKSAGTKRNFQKTIKSTVDKVVEMVGGPAAAKKCKFFIASTLSNETDTMLKGALNYAGITDIVISPVPAATLGYTGVGAFGLGAMKK